ncbi:uncharacterized protein KY384_001114 [Bacidia gigantensis]|uniref:uncharacterized protein n=1 Tax=Bacidia gigantensis TaxID=2732470 RepID=UPI001D04E049|nr:uncharacterized protein KY384_001114 [Bacidia gigantensis]KAG8534270.1 hypothetical protein KY384_001114 [Bacidia gigantensis]
MDSQSSKESKEETAWNPHMLQPLEHVQTRSTSPKSLLSDRRHSSSASTSTRSTGDDLDSNSSRGRRSRPSVTASSANLITLRERREQRDSQLSTLRELTEQRDERALSGNSSVTFTPSQDRPSLVSPLSSEKFRLGSEEKVVLQSFSKVVSRNVDKEEARQQQLDRYNQENEVQREIYRRLVKWEDTKHVGWTDYMLSWLLQHFRHSPIPDSEELKSLARHYYPPRSELKCHVCDFGPGKAEHKVVDLGQIEEYMVVKPDWADVRWVHCPLGLGLMHSSVEDIFMHEGEIGRSFENAGRSGFPYLETEILNFRHRENFQEMRDVYLLLRDRDELDDDLNESTWKADHNASLHTDIDWRAKHLATKPNFWNLVSSDMPWQLSEGLSMGAMTPKFGLQAISRKVEDQILSMFPFYEDAQLVRDPFRAFHRGDGFLLTLSPMGGVNYLDKSFSEHLAEPLDAMFENDDASAVGHSYQAFAESGTDSWHRRNVEWFLIYLMTEVGTTPHPMRQGFNAPTVDSAYSSVIQELKRQRFDEWQPKVTVTLVRKYLNCLDELTYITLNLKKKMSMFKAAQLDIKSFELEDKDRGNLPDNPDGESALQRLEWAITTIKNDSEYFERLLIDLKQSLDALFQIRSIEQNDMQIVSDSQNKAILVFTGVTTVFLPLSFFTSYFGMNLEGIANTKESQGYFWKVCGTVAFLIVLVITFGAFSHHLRRVSRQRMRKSGAIGI